ncbi:hypothetical protein GN156_09205 [bacterium LRH843]|nr:hypothetical protein [bacterium LRH843]
MTNVMGRLKKKVSSNYSNKLSNQSNMNEETELLLPSIKDTIQKVKDQLGDSNDIVIREFKVHEGKKAALIFTDGLVDSSLVQEVMESLIYTHNGEKNQQPSKNNSCNKETNQPEQKKPLIFTDSSGKENNLESKETTSDQSDSSKSNDCDSANTGGHSQTDENTTSASDKNPEDPPQNQESGSQISNENKKMTIQSDSSKSNDCGSANTGGHSQTEESTTSASDKNPEDPPQNQESGSQISNENKKMTNSTGQSESDTPKSGEQETGKNNSSQLNGDSQAQGGNTSGNQVEQKDKNPQGVINTSGKRAEQSGCNSPSSRESDSVGNNAAMEAGITTTNGSSTAQSNCDLPPSSKNKTNENSATQSDSSSETPEAGARNAESRGASDQGNAAECGKQNLIDFYKEHYIAIGELTEVNDIQALYGAVLSGDSVFLIDGETKGLSFGTKGWESRSIMEPTTQTVIRGPRESFTENLRTNTALIRRRIKSPNLWMETKTIGKQTRTTIVLMYLNGTVNPKVVDEIKQRLDLVNVDGVFDSGMVEELIGDAPLSPFPTAFTDSERPDSVASSILEGRVAMVVDGSPFVLLAPTAFTQFFQSAEDYYQRFYVASTLRLLRFLCVFISLLGLPVYIAIGSFHQEMLPTPLLNSIAAQREGVPFPGVVEVFFLAGSFEILREAGVRMPRAIGAAVSIVGGLVLGTSAVEAGFVSASMVIVVAIVALADFVSPAVSMSNTIKLFRYLLLIFAASFGMYGIAIGLVAIVLHLCSLRSFGVPYMTPIGPFDLSDQKDTFVRFPQWAHALRPFLIGRKNPIREQMPAPSPQNTKK